jgi:hypothetical protein
MANPVVGTISPAGTINLQPGQQVDVTVPATDPDSKSGTVTFPIVDSAGNSTPATVNVVVNDPLAFGTAVVSAGLNVTVQRISVASANPGVYRITAAAG